ncbi:hypothetical protein [Sporosarcina limicola]|uniref:Cobyric acid synthase n=1 Tax=Sporosarcina limicola TaxID=34101 RepID=A0A927MJX8_9BACL|nr:hypothetical protein [Sporosarcina limicola]MBE1556099.1 cobyric acid synthase [Sporosarcina limicola]
MNRIMVIGVASGVGKSNVNYGERAVVIKYNSPFSLQISFLKCERTG